MYIYIKLSNVTIYSITTTDNYVCAEYCHSFYVLKSIYRYFFNYKEDGYQQIIHCQACILYSHTHDGYQQINH